MVDAIDIFVTEEFGLGFGVITIESNGNVTLTVFEPFFDAPITTKTFWYTVGDGLSTEAALVTVPTSSAASSSRDSCTSVRPRSSGGELASWPCP